MNFTDARHHLAILRNGQSCRGRCLVALSRKRAKAARTGCHGVILVEFVLAVAVFALAALALLTQIQALTTAVTVARRESALHQALASAMDEARARGARLEPATTTLPDGLQTRFTMEPVTLRNDRQIELRGLQQLSIMVSYPDEPPLTARFYVAKP